MKDFLNLIKSFWVFTHHAEKQKSPKVGVWELIYSLCNQSSMFSISRISAHACKENESQPSSTRRFLELLLEVALHVSHVGQETSLVRVVGLEDIFLCQKNKKCVSFVTLNPIMANMMMAANTEVAQLVKATITASLKLVPNVIKCILEDVIIT